MTNELIRRKQHHGGAVARNKKYLLPGALMGLFFAVLIVLVQLRKPLLGDISNTLPSSSITSSSATASRSVVLDREAHVRELLSHVQDEYKSMCQDMLEGKAVSFAQGWQDWMIYHNYFRDRKWGEGFYLDIGANDAVFISNTLFFDKCLGWRGICAEPQPQYHAGIKEKRSCELVPTCVLGKDTTVSKASTGVMFSVKETTESSANTMECVGIQSLKEKYGFEKIDLVSLDIEGMEPSVLSCWPFDKVDTTMFVVETNQHALNMVDFFFHRNGYVNADTYTNVAEGKAYFIDNLYVKDNKPFPHPPLGSAFTCTPQMKKYMGTWCNAFSMTMASASETWFKDCTP